MDLEHELDLVDSDWPAPTPLPAPRPTRRIGAHRHNPTTAGPATDDTIRDQRAGELTRAVVELGRLALSFAAINRTAVYHPDRVTPESDTDHTVMLGWVACAIAARCFPHLDLGLVAQFALVHDAPEVYAGDTPTLRITPDGRAAKAAREHAAIDRLRIEFGPTLPWFPAVIADYETQRSPEARFVRGLDKVLPKIVHLLDGATGLIEQGMSRTELAAVFSAQRTDMAGYCGEFTELMGLHADLVARVLTHPVLADPEDTSVELEEVAP